jgi:hypothetical protein
MINWHRVHPEPARASLAATYTGGNSRIDPGIWKKGTMGVALASVLGKKCQA